MAGSTTTTISRRQCLAGVGATMVLPFLESFGGGRCRVSAADANSKSAASRLVCIGVSLSMYPEEWNPIESGRNYTVPRLIKPLDALRRDFTLISNTDHPGVTGGHKGTPAFLSGVYRPERVGQAIVIRNQTTMDQLAAKVIGGKTRFSSLQLGAAGVDAGDSLSWDEKGVPLQTTADPLKAFDQLFVSDPQPELLARTMSRGRSILDLVHEDAQRLTKELSHVDRASLDQYMTATRDVERSIARQLDWLGTPKPSVPELTDRPTSYHANLDLILEVAALALQTNSTRVITVTLPGKGLPIEVGGRTINDYHGQSHHGKDEKLVENLVEIETLHTQSLARFLNRLKSTPMGEGSLLDCTQVLFGSGLGNGSSHSNRDLPILLAGGGFRHGSHLRLPEGTPLCNLFVTMLQQLGMEIDAFAGSNGNLNAELLS